MVDVADRLADSNWGDFHESPRAPRKDPLQDAIDRICLGNSAGISLETETIPEFKGQKPVGKLTAMRANSGKPELHYLFTFPKAVAEFARVCTYGERKYDRGNYLKGGKPVSEYADCLLRHLSAFLNGEDIDPESDCHHLGHVVWNALAICQFVLSGNCLDNRVHEDKYKKLKEYDDECLTSTFCPQEQLRVNDS